MLTILPALALTLLCCPEEVDMDKVGAELVTTAPPPVSPKEIRRMIDAIANQNAPPKLVKYPPLGRLPWFPEDYDWDEQERVRDALKQLRKCESPQLFDELIEWPVDERYALTIRQDPAAPLNFTVVDFCQRLALSQLLGVYRQYVEVVDHHVSLDVGVDELNLRDWRAKRKGHALWEMQLEVCERAILSLRTHKRLSADQKADLHRKISHEIEKLKESQTPIFPEKNIFGVLDTYDAKSAATIRKQLLKAEKAPEKKQKESE